ncbi:hypothetical protein NKR23_g3733 [Pleurostoma richardsiae]|uniref:Glycine cleavage system H protein n=1 Tax=Pleurostoma richardsiae TaxID=41990 RepID=A0AA38VWE6_9PEZI|nr:hypothetical protein NKR23_g3733 [Pleurostoma richardsiae]
MASLFARYVIAPAARRGTDALRPVAGARAAVAATRPRRAAPFIRPFSLSSRRLEKRYTSSHEWIDVGADGKTCKIGISQFASDALGDVVYIELPGVGDEAKEGEPFGSVESVKSASDVVSPVSGTIVAVNEALAEAPADLGKDPEGEGWLIEIEATEVSPVEALMDEGAYGEFTKEH